MKNPESLLRENIRDLISLVKKKKKNNLSEEQKLRKIIREFVLLGLKEAKTPDNDPAPHNSTGINVLEDLLKRIIPQLEDDYKILTTSDEQRKSFRAHIVNAAVKTLTPVEVNNAVNDEIDSPLEEEVDIEISDDNEDDMFIDIDPKAKEAEEAEVELDPKQEFGIEGQDTTGRDFAYNSFKKIESSIIDSYDLLSNADDQEKFYDYLITNLKLYFDKFENELAVNVEEPSSQAYDTAKAEEEETKTAEPPIQESIEFKI